MFIISGTREEFANYVKKKMEDLFIPRFPNVVLILSTPNYGLTRPGLRSCLPRTLKTLEDIWT